MKKILLLGQKIENLRELAKSVKDANTDVEVGSCEDLCFLIHQQEGQIHLANVNRELREYAKILVLMTPEYNKNHALNAMACYCRKYGIKVYDDSFSNFSGKLYEMWRFWENDLPVPDTAYGSKEFLTSALTKFGGTGVLKSTHTSKGRDNFMVHSDIEIDRILSEHPDKSFILQNFIPNSGDYRVIVLDYVPKMIIYRSANGKDFRNNTSLGGSATIVPLDKADSTILDIAKRAAQAFAVKIAGVDIIQNQETGEYSILEVNRTPQLTTGSFLSEKTAILKAFIDE